MGRIDPLYAGSLAMQPTAHAQAIAYASGIYAVTNQAGVASIAKGLTVKSGSAGGDLVVHLVDDFDVNGANAYTTLTLAAGDRLGFVFDEVKESGTTITLTDVQIWL